MAIFTIFWCAVLGIFFWLFSMLLKSIQSAIHGILEAVITCGSLTLLGMLGVFLLWAIYNIAIMIRINTGVFGVVLGIIVVIFLAFLLVFIGTAAGEIAITIVSVIVGIIISILEKLNPAVENAYVFFLKKIKQKVDLL